MCHLSASQAQALVTVVAQAAAGAQATAVLEAFTTVSGRIYLRALTCCAAYCNFRVAPEPMATLCSHAAGPGPSDLLQPGGRGGFVLVAAQCLACLFVMHVPHVVLAPQLPASAAGCMPTL